MFTKIRRNMYEYFKLKKIKITYLDFPTYICYCVNVLKNIKIRTITRVYYSVKQMILFHISLILFLTTIYKFYVSLSYRFIFDFYKLIKMSH